jgi:hypothetical protein
LAAAFASIPSEQVLPEFSSEHSKAIMICEA